jgi:hypothetical protein
MSKDIFDESNVPESNWFKFEKVGDKVSGVVADNPTIKVDKSGEYGDQKVFSLVQDDGEVINVGIRVDKDYVISRTNKVRKGDRLGFLFKEEIPASKKGYNPAKSIVPFVEYTPEGDEERGVEAAF